ncbi:hypothetical protein ACFSDD_04425 [Salipiger marinus]|uniref:hypothetical protein n=1 Tax=Salipiger marinus TaxID=555512 RepID=UPI002B65B6B4|nr:hypothetical protein [Salipiger manganoxidans]MEB3417023.1 hypothetical protein [Salipiger manganoxidans]
MQVVVSVLSALSMFSLYFWARAFSMPRQITAMIDGTAIVSAGLEIVGQIIVSVAIVKLFSFCASSFSIGILSLRHVSYFRKYRRHFFLLIKLRHGFRKFSMLILGGLVFLSFSVLHLGIFRGVGFVLIFFIQFVLFQFVTHSAYVVSGIFSLRRGSYLRKGGFFRNLPGIFAAVVNYYRKSKGSRKLSAFMAGLSLVLVISVLRLAEWKGHYIMGKLVDVELITSEVISGSIFFRMEGGVIVRRDLPIGSKPNVFLFLTYDAIVSISPTGDD